MENNFYIFTEIANCGKIGRIALDSFHKYHNYPVHIYGTKADFEHIQEHKNNIFIEVSDTVLDGYKHGHVGTALLWEQVIKNCPQKYMVHFDSDVIFRASVIDDMIEKSKEYDLIGPIRNYHHNPQGIQGVRHLADVCQTNCTLWNRELISLRYRTGKAVTLVPNLRALASLSLIQIARRCKWFIKNILMGKNRLSEFARMIHGTYNPLAFQTIDFFDPVMFDMINNGAKIYHLDFDEVGGCDTYGKRDNAFREINNFPTPYKLDFGSKLVHFSCVGSGMNFYNNKNAAKNVGTHYVQCALDRYALFCKTFYNEELEGIPLDKYEKIFSIKNWY
jgi:hypothetical protein